MLSFPSRRNSRLYQAISKKCLWFLEKFPDILLLWFKISTSVIRSGKTKCWIFYLSWLNLWEKHFCSTIKLAKIPILPKNWKSEQNSLKFLNYFQVALHIKPLIDQSRARILQNGNLSWHPSKHCHGESCPRRQSWLLRNWYCWRWPNNSTKIIQSEHPKKLEKELEADSQQKLVIRFLLKEAIKNKLMRVHQAFLRL